MTRSRGADLPDVFFDYLDECAAHAQTKLELSAERRRAKSLDSLFEGKKAVSTSEIADTLNISTRTVKRHIESGKLNSFAFGGVRRVPTRDLLAWLHGDPAPPEPGDEILTVVEAAAEVGVHPDTIRRWLRDGDLSFWRTGSRGAIRIGRTNLYATVKRRPRTEAYNQKRSSGP